MIGGSLFVALSEMRRHPVRTLLTVSGVAIAIATVVGVGSMLGSVQQLMSAMLTESGGLTQVTVVFKELRLVNGHWTPASRVNPLSVEDSAAIRTALPDQVEVVSLRATVPGILGDTRTSQQINALAVEPDYFAVFRRRVLAGRVFDDHDIQEAALVAVIGQYTAKSFFGRGDAIGRELRFDNVRLRVVGVVADMGVGQEKRLELILPITTARFRFAPVGARGQTRSIYVRIRDEEDLAAIKPLLLSTVLARHRGYDSGDFEIVTAEESLAQARQGMALVGLAFSLICGLCLLTGGVGVMNILLSSVAERTREIGVRAAVGARKKDVLMQFILEAISFTLLGGVIGITLGYAFGFLLSLIVNLFINIGSNVEYRLRPSLDPAVLIAAVLTSALVGIIFGLYPALKASRLDPVEALHVE